LGLIERIRRGHSEQHRSTITSEDLATAIGSACSTSASPGQEEPLESGLLGFIGSGGGDGNQVLRRRLGVGDVVRRHVEPDSVQSLAADAESATVFNHDRVEELSAKTVADTITVFEPRLVSVAARSFLSHCSAPFTRGRYLSGGEPRYASPRQ